MRRTTDDQPATFASASMTAARTAARTALNQAISDALPPEKRLSYPAHLELLARVIKAADADETVLLLERAPIAQLEHWASLFKKFTSAPARAGKRTSLPPLEQRPDLN